MQIQNFKLSVHIHVGGDSLENYVYMYMYVCTAVYINEYSCSLVPRLSDLSHVSAWNIEKLGIGPGNEAMLLQCRLLMAADLLVHQ